MTRAPLDAELLVHAHDTVGESPFWCPRTHHLWWTDIDGCRIHALDWSDQSLNTWSVAERTGCISPHAGGGVIAGMTSGIYHLQPRSDGSITSERIYDCQHPLADMRFNDGRTDRAGRFWSSTMLRVMADQKDVGRIYVTEHGHTREVLSGLRTANGMAFSPGGSTMYLSDSHPDVQKVWAMDLDAAGNVSNRRVFIDMTQYPGRPDGAAVDAEGGYWICGNDAGLVHRFTPDGRWDRSVRVPVAKPAMCAFAGPNLDTLVITTIRPAQPPAEEAALAGAVFAVVPGVRGLAETPYQPA